jgi:hypothetical protein
MTQLSPHDLHIPSASEVGWGVPPAEWNSLGETKANVRKPNGETMGNHRKMICKWWVFHISWCGYRKVLNFVVFLLLETKVSTIQCRGSQSFTSRPSPGWWSKSCSKRGGASQQLKLRNDGWTWPRKRRPSAESKRWDAVLGKMALKLPPMCRSEPYVAVPKILAQVSTEMNKELIYMAIGSTQ